MLAGTIIGISSTLFVGVATGLLSAIVTGLYNRHRAHSLWRALLAGGVAAVVGLLVVNVAAELTGGDDGGEAPTVVGSARPESQPEKEADEDEDGLADAVDSCPFDVGEEPSGCPDSDSDGLLDLEDRCPEEVATTSDGCPDRDGDQVVDGDDRCPDVNALTEDGCPERPKVANLASMIGRGSREFYYEENTSTTEVTVGGVAESLGVLMSLGSYVGEFLIPTSREFDLIRGRVGITSEPCSEGSDARVAIRDAEGRQLWPKTGGPLPVDRDAEPFEARITSEDAVVLYAEGSEGKGYCGTYPDYTKVGWVRVQLLVE